MIMDAWATLASSVICSRMLHPVLCRIRDRLACPVETYDTTNWLKNAGFGSGMPPGVIWKAITPSYGLD